MSEAYNNWYQYYHNEGEKLRADVKQSENRVNAFAGDQHDKRFSQANYDHLQAGIKYNHFASDEVSIIKKDTQVIERKLKTEASGTFQHQSLDKQLIEQNERFSAWTQVLIDDKHRPVHINDVSYEGKIYSMYRPPEWDNSTVKGVFQSGVEWFSNAAQNDKESSILTQKNKQDLCKQGVNALVGMMVPNLGGEGFAGALLNEAQGQAMQGGVAESCRRTFPTTDPTIDEPFRYDGAHNTATDSPELLREQVAQTIRTDLPFNGRELNAQERQIDQALSKFIVPKLQTNGYSEEQIANVKTGCMLKMAQECPGKDLVFAGIHSTSGKIVMGTGSNYDAPTVNPEAVRDQSSDHQVAQQQQISQQVAAQTVQNPVRTI